jgi:hypothetical protein
MHRVTAPLDSTPNYRRDRWNAKRFWNSALRLAHHGPVTFLSATAVALADSLGCEQLPPCADAPVKRQKSFRYN